MKKILILSTNRADFSHLRLIIKAMKRSDKLKPYLCAAGSHFDVSRGKTIDEIVEKGIDYDYKINLKFSFKSEAKINNTIISFQKRLRVLLKYGRFDYIMVLGDRLEMLAVVNLVLITNIKLIHISGGERTKGAVDDYIRNMLSLCASINFVSGEYFLESLGNLLNTKENIYNVGDPILEMIKKTKINKFNDFIKTSELKLKKNRYILLTHHPETNTNLTVKRQIEGIETFLRKTDKNVLITAPNIDNGGDYIMKVFKGISKERKNIIFRENLGFENYILLMKNALCVMGNSSSNIIEAPFLKKMSILIGQRQEGRPLCNYIIKTGHSFEQIVDALKKAEKESKVLKNKKVELKYECKETSKLITDILEKSL